MNNTSVEICGKGRRQHPYLEGEYEVEIRIKTDVANYAGRDRAIKEVERLRKEVRVQVWEELDGWLDELNVTAQKEKAYRQIKTHFTAASLAKSAETLKEEYDNAYRLILDHFTGWERVRLLYKLNQIEQARFSEMQRTADDV